MEHDHYRWEIINTTKEALAYQERGDVVMRDQCIRTLDDLMGFWRGGKFIGGQALVNGLTYDAMVQLRDHYDWRKAAA